MASQKICGIDKYLIFESGTIYLPVEINDLPESIPIEGSDLKVKDEFHVSLVCIDKLIQKHSINIANFKELVTNEFCDFVKENDISLTQYKNEFRFVQSDDLRSLVVMCDVSNLDKFFKLLNGKYSLSLEIPPTHVTLYVASRGIYLIDQDDIQTKTKLIKPPEELKTAFKIL